MSKRRHRRKPVRFMEYLDLPVETLPGIPKLTLLGRDTVLVENHKGILEYNSACVRLITALGILRIGGADMELKELGSELVTVRGQVESVLFEMQ
ncbi:MAG: YabP family protein [Firmicutes bacterium ADurb.Bin182]|nr:MAG: YabP family protein [Firmicutes bacterium ADurb.Bin182]